MPSAITKTLGKAGRLCRVLWPLHSAKAGRLCRVPQVSHSAKRAGFAECPREALGKATVTVNWRRQATFLCRVVYVAECPTKDTRQRGLCHHRLCRVIFAEGYTRQRLCRVYMGICRVSQALDKEPESGSACHRLAPPTPWLPLQVCNNKDAKTKLTLTEPTEPLIVNNSFM